MESVSPGGMSPNGQGWYSWQYSDTPMSPLQVDYINSNGVVNFNEAVPSFDNESTGWLQPTLCDSCIEQGMW